MRSSFLLFVSLIFSNSSPAQSGFWAPVEPPRAQYRIEAAFDATNTILTGSETISFRNTTSRVMERLALDWNVTAKRSVTILANGKPATLIVAPGQKEADAPVLVQLPEALPPGGKLELKIDFRDSYESGLDKKDGELMQGWYPQLWWGFGTLDDYVVRFTVPKGWTMVSSGVFDKGAGIWNGKDIRDFAVVLFSEDRFSVEQADAGDVHVSVVHTAAGAKCAQLLLQTAEDVIGFYRQRFGFYPHRSVTIIPGGDEPVGGYPAATALVVIHGEEHMEKKPEAHFRWITAHEIGHMYWSQYVLAKGEDTLDWLVVGLGIFADREYRRARNLTTINLSGEYVNGTKQGFDTTMDVSSEQEELIDWDFNNIVEHGKSSAMMDALESTIGVQTFDRVYRRCLREFHARRIGWRDFERVSEEESGEDLGWFFESWVRTNQYGRYRVNRHETKKTDSGWHTEVEVVSQGTRVQRVPVVATFEDGSEQKQGTDRLAKVSVLAFESKAPLREVKIDPENALWMLDAEPALSEGDLERKLLHMSLMGSSEDALALLPRARQLQLRESRPWRRLGLMLYDGKHYAESLECFQKAAQVTTDKDYQFLSLAWQGQLLDLLGRRDAAIEAYKAAQATGSEAKFRHDQYKLRIDQAWVKERLQTPFKRE